MVYIPKNIRAGLKIEKARELLKNYPKGDLFVSVCSRDHGRDVNGNGTAHYDCCLILKTADREYIPADIVASGFKREQVGYSGANEAAVYALNQLGYELDLSKKTSYDYQGSVEYPITNL